MPLTLRLSHRGFYFQEIFFLPCKKRRIISSSDTLQMGQVRAGMELHKNLRSGSEHKHPKPVTKRLDLGSIEYQWTLVWKQPDLNPNQPDLNPNRTLPYPLLG